VQRLIKKFHLQSNGRAGIPDPRTRCVPHTTQALLWRRDGARDNISSQGRSGTGHDDALPEFNLGPGLNMDGWLRQDEPLFAGLDAGQSTSQWAIDSVDFLWDLPV
jgi:hypothetical protein